MTKLICSLLIGVGCLLPPGLASAANTIFSVSVTHLADDATVGELIFNGQVVWRLKICSDGAETATAVGSDNTTLVIPDIVDGLFLLRVYNQ